MKKKILYHNPKCSKSREALKILTEKKISFEVIEYLKKTPSVSELELIIKNYKGPLTDLVRQGEESFKQNPFPIEDKKELSLSLHEQPSALQRPILVVGESVVIGRPPSLIEEAIECLNKTQD